MQHNHESMVTKATSMEKEWAFNAKQFEHMIAFDQGESTLCCCKEHVPHDESLKFIMTATDENL